MTSLQIRNESERNKAMDYIAGLDLAKPKKLDLEMAMEFCAGDECVEVTPEVVRVRKVHLDSNERARERSRSKTRDKAAL